VPEAQSSLWFFNRNPTSSVKRSGDVASSLPVCKAATASTLSIRYLEVVVAPTWYVFWFDFLSYSFFHASLVSHSICSFNRSDCYLEWCPSTQVRLSYFKPMLPRLNGTTSVFSWIVRAEARRLVYLMQSTPAFHRSDKTRRPQLDIPILLQLVAIKSDVVGVIDC